MNTRFPGLTLLLASTCLGLAGCAHSEVSLLERDAPYKDIDVHKPDFIIVTKVAVTPEQARKLSTLRIQSPAEHVPNADDQRIGNAFSSALQAELVKAITAAGIKAYSEGSAPEAGFKTGIVFGYCLQGTAGSPAGSVGFQLKENHFGVRVIFNIKEVPVNGVTIDVHTRLRSGMSDDDVNKIATEEARMAADKLTQELLVPAYKKRGWLN